MWVMMNLGIFVEKHGRCKMFLNYIERSKQRNEKFESLHFENRPETNRFQNCWPPVNEYEDVFPN